MNRLVICLVEFFSVKVILLNIILSIIIRFEREDFMKYECNVNILFEKDILLVLFYVFILRYCVLRF